LEDKAVGKRRGEALMQRKRRRMVRRIGRKDRRRRALPSFLTTGRRKVLTLTKRKTRQRRVGRVQVMSRKACTWLVGKMGCCRIGGLSGVRQKEGVGWKEEVGVKGVTAALARWTAAAAAELLAPRRRRVVIKE
jgi:hypothetical protein